MTWAHEVARPLVDTVSVHMVSPQWAPRVVSPMHDVLSESERRAILADNPDSYLHVTSDPLALPEGPDGVAADSVQAKALRRLLDLGAYTPLPEPALFVYRLTEHGRDHTGLIAGVAVEGFRDGRVLGHERVQPDRVAGLISHYQRVSMRSEVVSLFHPGDPVVAELTARVVARPPLLSFTDASGVVQSIWQAGPGEAAVATQQLGGQRLYVADGHHRVAAATALGELAAQHRKARVLCAIYPKDEIVLHAFHRRVRGPVAVPALLEGLAVHFEVVPGTPPPSDKARDGFSVDPGCIGLHAAGRWWTLRPREPRRLPGTAGLDVTMLDDQILRPLLGIGPGDPRLEFVPDVREREATTRECDTDGGVLFTLHAPCSEDIIEVAERHEVMGTKSTYVRPKPRTGIFLS
jgi:uncharacterized protein (DUF1015 family)